MTRMSWLGLGFLAPALIVVVLFFLLPAVLTGFFAFTNMSTATGIKGGEYALSPSSLRALGDAGVNPDTLDQLANAGYVVDAKGLQSLAERFTPATAEEMEKLHGGAKFSARRDMERALKDLRENRIRKTRDRKDAAELFKASILNERFATEAAFRAALVEAGLPQVDHDRITTQAYTGVDTARLMEVYDAAHPRAGRRGR